MGPIYSILCIPNLITYCFPVEVVSVSLMKTINILTDSFLRVNILCSSSQTAGGDSKFVTSLGGTIVQQDLYAAISAASSWLDAAENQLLSGPMLLSEDTETQLANLEVLKTLVTDVVIDKIG